MTVLEAEAAREHARIAAVHAYDVLDTPPDGTFDRIASVAARVFGVPIGIVSIVDTDRIWFKAHHGLPDVHEISREEGLCASAIRHDEPWVVTDASTDPRTLTNSLVAGDFGLRFYAGVPLTTNAGTTSGRCACWTPRLARSRTPRCRRSPSWLARRPRLDLRLATREAVRVESALRRDAEDLARALQSSLLPPRPPDIPGMELATRYLPGDGAVAVGGDFLDVFHLASNDWAIVLGDACGKGPAAAGVAALARWSARAAAVHHVEPAAVLSDVNAVLRAEAGAADDRFCTAVFGRLQLDTCGAWLTVAAAGHPLPVLVRRNGIVEERGRPGLPIGMFDTITLVTDRVGLGPGDALVFYTDGITESRNTAGETFGEERLMAVLRDVAGETSETIADAVVAAARRFGTRLRDDVAVLVVRVPDDAAPAPTDNVATATATATGSDRDR